MKQWLRDRRRRSEVIPSAALVGALIGDLDGPTAVVDDHGRIGSIDGSWWLEWGVGAEDRWHIAHDEVAVRQSRVSDAPVYETWMRVPTGDVIQRVGSSNDGLGRALVVEFENASGSAVVVAVAGRVAAGARLAADADAVSLDGVEWIRAERPAGGTVAVAGDPWPTITSEPDAGRVEVDGADETAGALVVALPHRQTVRFEVLLEGEFPSRPVTPDEISAGWRTVTADSLTVAVPDTDLGEAWDRILPDLVVQAGSADPRHAAEAAWVLDIAGLHREADRARATVVAATEAGALAGTDAVAALRALASRELMAGRPSGLDELAGLLVAGAGKANDPVTLDRVARALDVNSPAAAADSRRAASFASGSFEPVTAPAVAAERVLSHVIAADRSDRIELLPTVPASWHGQPIDVRGCGTPNGRVSFSVRWHGERPALLWERTGGADAIELRCPGLDRSWHTLERSGETLLAPPTA